MKIKFRLFLFLLLMLPVALVAQDVTLSVKTKKQVQEGEQFQLTFELNAEGGNFQAPAVENAQIISGPMSSTSSNVQIINGAVTRSFTHSYTYYLRASKEGEIKVGEAVATIDGKKIKSEPVTIKVVTGNVQAQSNSNTTSGSSATGLNNDDVFLKAVVNEKNVFVGEQLIVTYKLYTKVQVSSISISKSSNYGGFWTKNLTDNNGNFNQTTELVNGEEYVVAEIQRFALFPQRSGKLTIDPMEIECTAVIRSQNNNRRNYDPFESFFSDPFFNRNYTNVQKKLTTTPIEINVQQQPLANKPSSFEGAVGQFDFQAVLDQDHLKTNEAFNLVMTISGKGNIELIDFPKPNFPPDFEVYEPKVTSRVKTSAAGVSGSRKAEYLVIPRVHGDFKIDSLVFSYFDPDDRKYKSIVSKTFQVHVSRGAQSPDSETVIYSANQEGIKYLGSDIHYIKTDKLLLKKKNAVFFFSIEYFVILAVIVLVFFTLLFYYAKKMKLNKNQILMRNKKATKIARKRLKSAHQHLKQRQQNEFYIEMSQALWGYISDKFGVLRSNLSMDTVREVLMAKNVSEELVNEFIVTLENCEFARFAPGDTNKKMDDLYTQGIDMITKVEKLIK